MDIYYPEKDTVEKMVEQAIKQFWQTRKAQKEKNSTGTKADILGNRGSVTGGKQLDGFVDIIKFVLLKNKINEDEIFFNKKLEIPGYYRPTKQWDLLVVKKENNDKKKLLAAIEFKSQVGSLGNNFNNRTEEALGSSVDIWTAFREGAFENSMSPFVGYLMIVEHSENSLKPRSVKAPHFPVLQEFNNTSYAKRYEIFTRKLVLERKYTSAGFLMSNEDRGLEGHYVEPSDNLNMEKFLRSLIGHITTELGDR
ncbi:PaeR7I family type II restriction endonuclease [Bacillus sp. JCM 19041]|uniref:PaeR7I family type II restriction endonuclease n=1 Tax=Bacillus sp. JCM 19041 TaxID=1460637 RepID=UPI0009EC5DF1